MVLHCRACGKIIFGEAVLKEIDRQEAEFNGISDADIAAQRRKEREEATQRLEKERRERARQKSMAHVTGVMEHAYLLYNEVIRLQEELKPHSSNWGYAFSQLDKDFKRLQHLVDEVKNTTDDSRFYHYVSSVKQLASTIPKKAAAAIEAAKRDAGIFVAKPTPPEPVQTTVSPRARKPAKAPDPKLEAELEPMDVLGEFLGDEPDGDLDDDLDDEPEIVLAPQPEPEIISAPVPQPEPEPLPTPEPEPQVVEVQPLAVAPVEEPPVEEAPTPVEVVAERPSPVVPKSLVPRFPVPCAQCGAEVLKTQRELDRSKSGKFFCCHDHHQRWIVESGEPSRIAKIQAAQRRAARLEAEAQMAGK
jgi:hypothetical protein